MKTLVTGAKGQLGTDLVPRLASAGFDVIGLDSRELDVTDRKRVEEASRGCGLIINCGAYTKVDLAEKERERAFAVNKDGAANLADAAKKAGAVLLHISTDFVFDGKSPAPYKEEDPVNPLSVYGESKLKGEEEIAGRLLEHIIVRTSWLYGSTGNNFVKTMIRLAGERDRLRVVYDQAGCPTWTGDLADALVTVAGAVKDGRAGYGIYHYSNEGVASWYDFADVIIEEAEKRGASLRCRTVEPILTKEYPTPAKRPAYSVMDKEKIKKALGLTIPHWRVSLRNMLNELYGGRHA